MKALVTLFALLFWVGAQAGTINTQGFGNTAIKGYDPVAYFTESMPVEGNKRFSYSWQGAEWHFSNATNRERFVADPGAYAPQYGGYCAYAVANGYTAKIDPEAWRVVEGKLYLNYSKSVQKLWEANIPGHIRQGDHNWPEIMAEL